MNVLTQVSISRSVVDRACLLALAAACAAAPAAAQRAPLHPAAGQPVARAPAHIPVPPPQRAAPTTPAPLNIPVQPVRGSVVPPRVDPRNPENAIVPITAPPPASTGCSASAQMAPLPVTLTLASLDASPEEKAAAREAARKFFAMEVPARRAAPAARIVTRLRWHGSLDTAKREAARNSEPILLVQALGDVGGFT